MLRHRANHGFTPIIGSSRSLLPPHPGRDAGLRVKVDDDLADQAGLGALEPGLGIAVAPTRRQLEGDHPGEGEDGYTVRSGHEPILRRGPILAQAVLPATRSHYRPLARILV